MWFTAIGVALALPSFLLFALLADMELPRLLLLPPAALLVLSVVGGLAVTAIAVGFLEAEYALRLDRSGVSGWVQTGSPLFLSVRYFEVTWAELESAAVVKRWGGRHVRIASAAGEVVFINPVQLAGYSSEDGDVIAQAITDRRDMFA